MTYLEIPQAARLTGANAIKGTWTLFETCPELAQEVTDLVLSAALPHLLAEVKVLTETATKVAYALGRKDAGEEIAEVLEGINPKASTLACASLARNLTSPSQEASDGS